MNLDALVADLEARRPADDPDGWAIAAYRLAVARSELATRPDELDEAIDLLDRAGRILAVERAPLEHGRILTAAASCHRAAGRPDRALPLFERAVELLDPRAPTAERAAALINVGLARSETGRAADAVVALGRAIDLLAPEGGAGAAAAVDPSHDGGDERTRLLGAAHLNRAQAHQAAGDDESPARAVTDYHIALDVLAPETPQAGMAAHGLGAALLELDRRRPDPNTVERAIAAFERSLGVFGPAGAPLQHAVARHSLALAHERRGRPGDLTRALDGLEAALSLFDPRLHPTQWGTAARTLERVEAALAGANGPDSRAGHLVRFLAATTAEERQAMLGERLRRLAGQPPPRRAAELGALARAQVALPAGDHDRVLRSLITVLMALPDPVLETACAALVAANREAGDPEARDRLLDRVIHDTLFGPQRVRVRDLLEASGWVRP